METIKEIAEECNATELEEHILNVLYEQLEGYILDGDDFSDTDVNDLAQITGFSKSVIKGVVGSLVKKNVLYTWNTGTGYDVIGFINLP